MPTNISGPALVANGTNPILISLAAFGAAEVRRHGQLWFTRLSHDAGADGIEVRSELLVDAATELPAIAQAVQTAGMRVVYSCADNLWTAGGSLDSAEMAHLQRMARLIPPLCNLCIGCGGNEGTIRQSCKCECRLNRKGAVHRRLRTERRDKMEREDF